MHQLDNIWYRKHPTVVDRIKVDTRTKKKTHHGKNN